MISREVDYAMRCLVYLAKRNGKEWVTTGEISRQLRVSGVFLAKIFQKLAREKVLETWKGKGGGVRLKKRDVSMAEIINILEPRFTLNKCLGRGFHCFMEKSCPIRRLLGDLQKEIFAKLSSYSLQGLAQEA